MQGAIVSGVPEVLFVCVHNAGRSQMAAGLLAHHAQGRVRVRSAGSAPAGAIHRGVAEAMAAMGLDLSQEFPKPLCGEVVRAIRDEIDRRVRALLDELAPVTGGVS